jgi:hypothetical protein
MSCTFEGTFRSRHFQGYPLVINIPPGIGKTTWRALEEDTLSLSDDIFSCILYILIHPFPMKTLDPGQADVFHSPEHGHSFHIRTGRLYIL